MLCLMHQSGTGRLEVSGRPMTEKELSAILGDNPRTVKKLVAELREAGVSTIVDGSFIASSRIIRDFEKAERDRSNGRMGGNPTLKTKGNDAQGVNPEVKAQKPEARSQKPEKKEQRSADESACCAFVDFWAVWPAKVSKAAAEKAWRRLSADDRQAAYDAAKASWFERWQAAHPDANPIHPSSFLNGKRWHDQFPNRPGGKPMQRADGEYAGAFGFIKEHE